MTGIMVCPNNGSHSAIKNNRPQRHHAVDGPHRHCAAVGEAGSQPHVLHDSIDIKLQDRQADLWLPGDWEGRRRIGWEETHGGRGGQLKSLLLTVVVGTWTTNLLRGIIMYP